MHLQLAESLRLGVEHWIADGQSVANLLDDAALQAEAAVMPGFEVARHTRDREDRRALIGRPLRRPSPPRPSPLASAALDETVSSSFLRIFGFVTPGIGFSHPCFFKSASTSETGARLSQRC